MEWKWSASCWVIGGRLEEEKCCGVVGKLVRGYILDHYAKRGRCHRYFFDMQQMM